MSRHRMKIKKNDQVQIMTGKSAGKSGRVLQVDKLKNRVLVEGANIVKKAQRAKSQNEKGGIVDIEAPVHISNVKVICKKCGPTRVGFKVTDKDKQRICKKCGEEL